MGGCCSATPEQPEIDPITISKWFGGKQLLLFHNTSLCRRGIYWVDVTHPNAVMMYTDGDKTLFSRLKLRNISALSAEYQLTKHVRGLPLTLTIWARDRIPPVEIPNETVQTMSDINHIAQLAIYDPGSYSDTTIDWLFYKDDPTST